MRLFKLILYVFCMSLIMMNMIFLVEPAQKPERVIDYKPRKWPINRIPFQIVETNFTEDDLHSIRRSINHANSLWGVQFVEVKPWESLPSDYVTIRHYPDGCGTSPGGYKGGEHLIELRTKCLAKGDGLIAVTVIHELKHTMSFVHEHQRPDRNAYIRVRMENLDPTWRNKTAAYIRFTSLVANCITRFDTESIMMYPSDKHSKAGTHLIELLDPNDKTVLGQRRKVTKLDIIKVNKFYNTSEYYCYAPGYNGRLERFITGSSIALQCHNGSIQLGSQHRRCIYGGVWTGHSHCHQIIQGPSHNVRYCDFEEEDCPELQMVPHWRRIRVFDHNCTRLERDYSIGNHTGHVMVFEVGPNTRPKRWFDAAETGDHRLRTGQIPLGCMPGETRLTYCISFAHFSTNSSLQLKVIALNFLTGERLKMFDSTLLALDSNLPNNEWRYDSINLIYDRCQQERAKMEIWFDAYLTDTSKTQFDLVEVLALDDLSIVRNGECGQANSVAIGADS